MPFMGRPTREIYIKHPAVNEGVETQLVDVEMTDFHELPPTRGGVERVRDIQMTVPINSPARSVLRAVARSQKPMRLRTDDHLGMWLISRDTPGLPQDGLYRATLTYAGPAAAG